MCVVVVVVYNSFHLQTMSIYIYISYLSLLTFSLLVSLQGANQCCAWKVTAIVFIILTVLLLVIAIVIGVIWLRG